MVGLCIVPDQHPRHRAAADQRRHDVALVGVLLDVNRDPIVERRVGGDHRRIGGDPARRRLHDHAAIALLDIERLRAAEDHSLARFDIAREAGQVVQRVKLRLFGEPQAGTF